MMLVDSVVNVGTMCRPSASVKVFLGHLWPRQTLRFQILRSEGVSAISCSWGIDSYLDLVAPIIGIDGLEVIIHDQTILLEISETSQTLTGTTHVAWRSRRPITIVEHKCADTTAEHEECDNDDVIDLGLFEPLVLEPWF